MAEIELEEEQFTTGYIRQTITRILRLTQPHWLWLIGFLFTIAAVSALDAYFTFLGKQIIDDAILPGDLQKLRTIIAQYAVLIFVQSVFVFGFIFLAGVLGERVQYELRKKSFNHLQDLSLSYFNRTAVGWIISRVTSDSERVANLMTWGLLDVTWALMNIGTAVFFMSRINPRLTLIVALILPVLVIVATQFQRRILFEYRRVRRNNSRITGVFNEHIAGIRVIKSLHQEAKSLEEFDGLSEEMYHVSYRAAWLSALFLPTVTLISSFAVGAVAFYGGVQIEMGNMTLGGLQAFTAYITLMLFPIQDLARVFAELQHAVASAERVFSLIDTEPEIHDVPEAYDPGTISGDIVFEKVGFSYTPGDEILTEFNLSIRGGETIALVGPTGGGKSTIVNLIARFFEPTNGRITIGGVDYRNFTLESIQSRIGMVLQTPHLFSGTILENMRYGRLDATDEEVIQAAITSGADQFVSQLKKGYETEVGEGGVLLSVGEKQLVSLARAVLAEPEIFIMDEATSSVDTITEARIQTGMESLTVSCTSFIIAHRLSTIKRADRIAVIEGGQIIECGSHTELLRKKGRYYQLYSEQFRRQFEQQADPFRSGRPAVAT